MTVRAYSLDEVVASIDGRRITEFAEGDAITVSFTADDVEAIQGSGGAVVFSDKNNNIADVTLNIVQGSPANQWLSELANARRGFDFVVQDARARGTLVSGRGRVRKRPDVTFADVAGQVEWALVLADVQHTIGTQDVV